MDHNLLLGRANLWYLAAKNALSTHLCNCPENDNSGYDIETGYAPSHCQFPTCFMDGYDHEGGRLYNDDACAHCQEARHLSNVKYAARLELSKQRSVVLRVASNQAKKDQANG